jgi:hypothetical protein
MRYFFTGAIDRAPRIILRVFTGASTIAPVSWQALTVMVYIANAVTL